MIPSKKVFALILVSISLVTCAFVFAEYKNETDTASTYTAQNQTTNLVAGTIDTYKDTDGDGLKDWEETLWGTDPKVADAEKLNKNKTPTAKKTENLTATDKLARSFFSQYMNLKEVGLQNDKDSQENIAKGIFSDTNFVQAPKPYTEKDIRISTTVTLRDYGNTVGAIFKNNAVQGRNEAAILKDALTADNPEMLKELDPILASYRTIQTGLRNIQVPPAAATAHVHLLNSMSQIIFVVDLFTKTFTDPVVGIQGTALYQQTFQSLQQSFAEVRAIFAAAAITFDQTETGIFFQPK